jgi:hypothetical protein
VVAHRHRESVRALLRQTTRDAAGRAWLMRRHPGSFPPERPARDAARGLLSAVRWLIAGQRERAAFRVIDAAIALSARIGTLLPNVPPEVRNRRDPRRGAGERAAVLLVNTYPAASNTDGVAELSARVEAAARADGPERAAAGGLDPCFREDDSALERLAASVWLCSRHPLRSLRDVAAQRRLGSADNGTPLRALAPVVRRCARGRESRLYANAVCSTVSDALRVSRLVGVPYGAPDRPGGLRRETARPAA